MVKIAFYINGKAHEAQVDESLTTLKLLREQLKLTGSREGCNEGDCGACTVLWGKNENGTVHYQAVNSCILPAVRLHGSHIVTIEGLKQPKVLHPIQQAFLEHNGAQCGFCTPGFIISIFSLLLDHSNPSDQQITAYLEGNLCRCTGYDAIVKAVKSLAGIKKSELLPAYFAEVDQKLLALDTQICLQSENYFRPLSLVEALALYQENPEATLLAGNTDLQPPANFYRRTSKKIIDLAYLPELTKIEIVGDKLKIGSSASLSLIARNDLVKEFCPALVQAISQMASNQIRNTATIGGNIANASPVADTVPVILAADAVLVLESSISKREVGLADFYLGYKQTVKQKNEIITAILIPKRNGKITFIKASKRKSVDISSLSSACCLKIENQHIVSAKIAVGGGGPVPLLITKTAEFLTGQEVSEITAQKAAEIAVTEISPISDVRGSADFRKTLLKNHLLIHLGLAATQAPIVQKSNSKISNVRK